MFLPLFDHLRFGLGEIPGAPIKGGRTPETSEKFGPLILTSKKIRIVRWHNVNFQCCLRLSKLLKVTDAGLKEPTTRPWRHQGSCKRIGIDFLLDLKVSPRRASVHRSAAAGREAKKEPKLLRSPNFSEAQTSQKPRPNF